MIGELGEAATRVGDLALFEGIPFVINHANGVAKVSKINSNDRGKKWVLFHQQRFYQPR